MAIGITEPVANINDATDASSYAFASFTPAADSVLVVIIAIYGHNTDEATVADSGMGLTWTKRDRFTWGTGAAHSVYAFEATVGASPAATVVTVTLPTDAATGAIASMFQITGTGVTFVQKANVASLNAVATVTMGAALNTNNAYVVGGGNANNPPAIAPPTSWTEVCDLGHPSSEGGYGAYRVNGESGTTVSLNGGSSVGAHWGFTLLEYAETGAPAGAPVPVFMSQYRQRFN